MKKSLISLILILALMSQMLIPVKAANTFELWALSPQITSGYTEEAVEVLKGVQIGGSIVKAYKLSNLGSNVFLLLLENRVKSGYNNKSDLSALYYYTVVVDSSGGFIVLGKSSYSASNVMYYQNAGLNLYACSSEFTNAGVAYFFYPKSQYANLNGGWDAPARNEFFITTSGTILRFTHAFTSGGIIGSTGGRLHKVEVRKNSQYYYTDVIAINISSGGTGYTLNNEKVYSKLQDSTPAEAEYKADGYGTVSFTTGSALGTSSHGITAKTNTFPDGRTLSTDAHYGSTSNGSITETWFNIYRGTTQLCRGSTGFHGLGTVTAFPVNDTKFIISNPTIGTVFYKEFYRVAVVEDNSSGDVVSAGSGGAASEKNISVLSNSDVTSLKTTIDLTADSWELGYQIKDGIVTDQKLESSVAEAINTINLGEFIVVRKSNGMKFGNYDYIDLGQHLGSNYTYKTINTLGSPITLYVCGTYFEIDCNAPQNLSVGTHDQSWKVGNKNLIFRVTVINPPTNSGSTTVKF